MTKAALRMPGYLFLALWVCISSGILAACAPAPTPESLPTSTPVPPTLTPTATIVWFPPTPTYTPYPTPVITPTQDLHPGVGNLILADDFSTSTAWSLPSSLAGTVGLGPKELSAVINQPKTYLYSFRSGPILDDFYAEITASPTFCQGTDEYGLLLRAKGSSNYYRFSLSCDGQVRLDRVVAGEASSPQPWMISGAFPPGAPSISRLGVWARGSELRFFINDVFQFTVHDPSLPSGGLGIFARSNSSDQVTVTFTNLVIKALSR